MLSAFPFVVAVKTVYKNKASAKIISYNDLTPAKNYRSVSVAMAGRARGAISPSLTFLLLFVSRQKVNKENRYATNTLTSKIKTLSNTHSICRMT
jgi:hypothetical protein